MCLLCIEDVQCVLWVQKVPSVSFFIQTMSCVSWMYRQCPVCPVLDVQEVSYVSYVYRNCPIFPFQAQTMFCVSWMYRRCPLCPSFWQIRVDSGQQLTSPPPENGLDNANLKYTCFYFTTGTLLGQRQFRIYTKRTLLDYSTAWTTPI